MLVGSHHLKIACRRDRLSPASHAEFAINTIGMPFDRVERQDEGVGGIADLVLSSRSAIGL